jgi:hypothetical protein
MDSRTPVCPSQARNVPRCLVYVGRSDGVFVHHRLRRAFAAELPHQTANSDLWEWSWHDVGEVSCSSLPATLSNV